MKVSLDFHDFSILNNRWDLLFELKEHYPKLKISMFTIPYDPRYEANMQTRLFREKALELLKKNLDWIQLIPHGLTHMPREFEKADKTTMSLTIKAIEETFKKDGLPYEKGFCAPYWLWNSDVVTVLDRNHWWGAVDRNHPDMLRPKKFYKYNHSISEPFWLDKENDWKLHGHIDGQSANDIQRCFLALMKIPEDAEWHFVTDFIEEGK